MLSALKPFRAFLGCSALAVLLASLIGTDHPVYLTLLCLLILFAGLPHGAFDYYIMAARYQGHRFAGALGTYLVLIGLTFALWWITPLIFLGSFLFYSAIHFGDSDWPGQQASRKWAWGTAVIALPCLLQPAAVSGLFAVISGVDDVATFTATAGLLAIPAVAWCCVPTRTPADSGVGSEPIPLLLLAYASACLLAGPLTAFACYFACLHSPFHLARWRRRIDRAPAWGIHALSAIVIVCVGALVLWLPVESNIDNVFGSQAVNDATSAITSSTVRYTFLALAALTVPHMTLLLLARR